MRQESNILFYMAIIFVIVMVVVGVGLMFYSSDVKAGHHTYGKYYEGRYHNAGWHPWLNYELRIQWKCQHLGISYNSTYNLGV
jgi:hypothetical protein